MNVIGEIELQMMRSKSAQLWNASLLKKMEHSINQLNSHMIAVLNTSEIMRVDANKVLPVPVLRDRLAVTPFFTGRENKLEQLKRILDDYASCAIMQYGGIGKTQLMALSQLERKI